MLVVLSLVALLGVVWGAVAAVRWHRKMWLKYDSRQFSIQNRPEWVPSGGTLLDLHFHTDASSDGALSPAQSLQYLTSRGYDGVAITDHNTVANIGKVQKMAPEGFLVIPGVEWSTRRFHANILGIEPQAWGSPPHLYQKYGGFGFAPSDLQIAEVIDWVHDHGGLVQYNHPAFAGCTGLTARELLGLNFDLVEAYNTGSGDCCTFDSRDTPAIEAFCSRHGIPVTAGSDTHEPSDDADGRCYVRLNERVHDCASALRLLAQGSFTVHCKRTPVKTVRPRAWSSVADVILGTLSFPVPKSLTKVVTSRMPINKFW